MAYIKLKNQELAPLHQEVKEIANSFEKDFVSLMFQENLNKIADGEVNRILDEHQRSQIASLNFLCYNNGFSLRLSADCVHIFGHATGDGQRLTLSKKSL
jgi:hypothetical protein